MEGDFEETQSQLDMLEVSLSQKDDECGGGSSHGIPHSATHEDAIDLDAGSEGQITARHDDLDGDARGDDDYAVPDDIDIDELEREESPSPSIVALGDTDDAELTKPKHAPQAAQAAAPVPAYVANNVGKHSGLQVDTEGAKIERRKISKLAKQKAKTQGKQIGARQASPPSVTTGPPTPPTPPPTAITDTDSDYYIKEKSERGYAFYQVCCRKRGKHQKTDPVVLQLTEKQFGGIENAETAARALKRQLDQDMSWEDVKK